MVGESRAQRLDRPQAVREQERRSRLEPVHTRGHADCGCLQCFVEEDQVEGELDDGVGEVVEIHLSFPLVNHSSPNRANEILS